MRDLQFLRSADPARYISIGETDARPAERHFERLVSFHKAEARVRACMCASASVHVMYMCAGMSIRMCMHVCMHVCIVCVFMQCVCVCVCVVRVCGVW